VRQLPPPLMLLRRAWCLPPAAAATAAAHQLTHHNRTALQECTRGILASLFPSWLPGAFKLMFAKPLPAFSCKLNALATALSCQWLMGPCKVNDVELDGGGVSSCCGAAGGGAGSGGASAQVVVLGGLLVAGQCTGTCRWHAHGAAAARICWGPGRRPQPVPAAYCASCSQQPLSSASWTGVGSQDGGRQGRGRLCRAGAGSRLAAVAQCPAAACCPPPRAQVGQAQGVLVERCRYLEQAGCASICINSCKVPTQVSGLRGWPCRGPAGARAAPPSCCGALGRPRGCQPGAQPSDCLKDQLVMTMGGVEWCVG
jgi:hypothetical protein